jgi:hypothetical protein
MGHFEGFFEGPEIFLPLKGQGHDIRNWLEKIEFISSRLRDDRRIFTILLNCPFDIILNP